MTIHEANDRLKRNKLSNEHELWAITPIYCLLNFDKDDFCKLLDAIGLEKWIEAANRWKRLDTAEQELAAKEKYLKAKAQIKELETKKSEINSELERLEQAVNAYTVKNISV